MTKSLACLGLAILLFVTQTITKLSPGVVALFVAMILFVITKVDVEHMLEEIEWSTLLFFAGLFILVGVLEEKGVIEWIARNVFLRIGDNPYVVVLVVLWVSGIASGFLDNIPFTITMIPIVRLILESNPIPNDILWWALSLGACLGGNLTMIGASANIVSIGMAKKFNPEHQLFGVYEGQCRHHDYNAGDCIGIPDRLLMGFAMKEKDKEILYKLFRDHEDVRGSSRMAMLALRSFIESIKDLRCNASEIKELITELCDAIKHTEPRIVPLIHMIKAFETEMAGHYGEDLQKTKNEAIRI